MRNKILPWIGLIVVLILFILVVPITLNYVLRIKVPTPVIGGDNSEAVWLAFWGAYLSAIGSCVMAIASLKMNKKNIENTRILHRLSEEKNNLFISEGLILKNDTIYSILRATEIVKYAEANARNAFRANREWLLDLKEAQMRFLKFFYGNHDSTSYCTSMKNASDFYVKLNGTMDELLLDLQYKNPSDDDYRDILKELESCLVKNEKKASELSEELSDAGCELLRSRYQLYSQEYNRIGLNNNQQ